MNRRSSFSRIDENVYLTLGGALVLFAVVFGFRFATHKECAPIKLTGAGGLHYTDELIAITAESKGAKTYQWDFGDGTAITKAGSTARHSFAKSGKYTITVSVNGSCSESIDILIAEKPIIIQKHSVLTFDITPANPFDQYIVNTPLTFIDPDTSHKSWEWNAEGEALQPARSVTYTFITVGHKLITLKVNNKEKIEKIIDIVEDPKERERKQNEIARRQTQQGVDNKIELKVNGDPAEKTLQEQMEDKKEEVTPKKTYPETNEVSLAAMIKGFNEGSISEKDFDQYFCDPSSTKVIYRSKTAVTWPEFMTTLKEMKQGKIKRALVVNLVKSENKCVQSFTVKLDKRGDLSGLK